MILLVIIDGPWVAAPINHHAALHNGIRERAIDGSLLQLRLVVLGQFAAQLHLLASINAVLLVSADSTLMNQAACPFTIRRAAMILSRVLIFTAGQGRIGVLRRHLLDVRQDHYVAVLVASSGSTGHLLLAIDNVIINGVSLFACSVQGLVHRNLPWFVAILRLDSEFLLVKGLFFCPEVVTLSLALDVEVEGVLLLLTHVDLLLHDARELVATLHAHRLALGVHRLDSL